LKPAPFNRIESHCDLRVKLKQLKEEESVTTSYIGNPLTRATGYKGRYTIPFEVGSPFGIDCVAGYVKGARTPWDEAVYDLLNRSMVKRGLRRERNSITYFTERKCKVGLM
jgi:hypothetical protein